MTHLRTRCAFLRRRSFSNTVGTRCCLWYATKPLRIDAPLRLSPGKQTSRTSGGASQRKSTPARCWTHLYGCKGRLKSYWKSTPADSLATWNIQKGEKIRRLHTTKLASWGRSQKLAQSDDWIVWVTWVGSSKPVSLGKRFVSSSSGLPWSPSIPAQTIFSFVRYSNLKVSNLVRFPVSATSSNICHMTDKGWLW